MEVREYKEERVQPKKTKNTKNEVTFSEIVELNS